MVPIERNGEGQRGNGIVWCQVGGPQETLLAQLDGSGEEVEEGDQYRHLQKHR